MQYTILPTDRDLIHWGKGKDAPNHKYKDKVRTASGKWRYIYDSYKNQKNLRKKVGENIKTRSKMINYQNKRQEQLDNLRSDLLRSAENGNDKEALSKAEEIRKLKNVMYASIESFENFNSDIDVTKNEYYNTPMGKAEKNIPGFGLILDMLNIGYVPNVKRR